MAKSITFLLLAEAVNFACHQFKKNKITFLNKLLYLIEIFYS